MKKPTFINDEIYHIYNRGTEKRKIFLDKQDHLRFIHNLFEFNDENSVPNFSRSFTMSEAMSEVEPRSRPRKLLVKILIFTLMPNHFHLLLKQEEVNGIVKFMQKLGTGYTMYFNKKYKRVGGLFQGRFKAVLINEHAHFLYLPYYIHLNPLSLPNKANTTTVSFIEKMNFLENYKWSSFPDYIGKKNFPSVVQREFLLDFFGGEKKYKKDTLEWLKNDDENTEEIQGITLD
ncbi:transposase [Patescibacteria group bacterium]|nr:transposase [Patescibacteria group bacterium]MBU1246676.1 transposase [Patescibacteria group bacterium]MBU1956310.1 transposase [Patescibacteria group bacterium]MBU2010264.1 transposase [Patescibacteria group bacterium]MBU2416643.1 transposase [Patescibacteria group bacterium]